MSNEITRSPAVIAGEINQIKSKTSGILAAALAVAGQSVIEIGRRLTEAKAIVSHGAWGDWLRDNVDYSVSTAENLMRCYREYGDEQIDLVTGKSPAEVFASLSYSQMVELFALPAPQRAEFVEANRDSLTGENAVTVRELREQIKALTEQHKADTAALDKADAGYLDMKERLTKRAEAAEQKAKEAGERADKAALEVMDYGKVAADRDAARARVAELEEQQPQEVTVIAAEPTPEQVAAIRAKALEEAYARHREEIQQLEADFGERIEEAKKEALQEQSKMVTDRIAKSNEKHAAAIAEADKEIKRLKVLANVHASKINFSLEAVNRAFSDMDTEIRAAEQETPGAGDKLRRQVVAMIGKMCDGRGWQV